MLLYVHCSIHPYCYRAEGQLSYQANSPLAFRLHFVYFSILN